MSDPRDAGQGGGPETGSQTRPEAGGEIRGKVHVLPIRIYYEDTDFSGVVYHANFLRYMERGRSDFLRLAGVHHAELWSRGEGVAFTVRRIEVDYRLPGRIDDLIEVHTAYTKAFGARIEARQAVWRGSELLVEAAVYAACINGAGRARRLPPDVIEKMRDFVEEG